MGEIPQIGTVLNVRGHHYAAVRTVFGESSCEIQIVESPLPPSEIDPEQTIFSVFGGTLFISDITDQCQATEVTLTVDQMVVAMDKGYQSTLHQSLPENSAARFRREAKVYASVQEWEKEEILDDNS